VKPIYSPTVTNCMCRHRHTLGNLIAVLEAAGSSEDDNVVNGNIFLTS